MMLDTLDPEDDVHSMTTNFENILSTLLDVFALAKMWMTSVRKYNPWFTSIMNLLKQKVRKCEKQWKQNPTNEHWLIFTACRREYFYAIRHAKKDVLKDRIAKCGKDSRRLFQLVHLLTGTKKNNPLPAAPFDKILANTFSEFFFNKISKICQDLDHHPMFDPPRALDTTNPLMQFHTVLSTVVCKCISSLPTKSLELDSIPISLLKQLLDYILDFITKIVNKSLTTSQFPHHWKNGLVKPLVKSPTMTLQSSNYHPVTNLIFLSKLLESITLDQLNTHCSLNFLLLDYQSAYHSHFSYETAIIKLHNDILWNMEKQSVTALIALDLSAAFDTVDHSILLSVLDRTYAVQDDALCWFQSYLDHWSCQVVINNIFSEPKYLPFSVPQGSCLGPMLFTVYASTLGTIPGEDTVISRYTDDHNLWKAFDPCIHNMEQITLSSLSKDLANIE